MRVFVWIELIPTIAGLGYGLHTHSLGEPTSACATYFLCGVGLQIVMMLYRVITGLVALLSDFRDVPPVLASVSGVLSRLLGAPSIRNSPPQGGETRRVV